MTDKDDLNSLHDFAERSPLRRFLLEHPPIRALMESGAEEISDYFSGTICR